MLLLEWQIGQSPHKNLDILRTCVKVPSNTNAISAPCMRYFTVPGHPVVSIIIVRTSGVGGGEKNGGGSITYKCQCFFLSIAIMHSLYKAMINYLYILSSVSLFGH